MVDLDCTLLTSTPKHTSTDLNTPKGSIINRPSKRTSDSDGSNTACPIDICTSKFTAFILYRILSALTTLCQGFTLMNNTNANNTSTTTTTDTGTSFSTTDKITDNNKKRFDISTLFNCIDTNIHTLFDLTIPKRPFPVSAIFHEQQTQTQKQGQQIHDTNSIDTTSSLFNSILYTSLFQLRNAFIFTISDYNTYYTQSGEDSTSDVQHRPNFNLDPIGSEKGDKEEVQYRISTDQYHALLDVYKESEAVKAVIEAFHLGNLNLYIYTYIIWY